MSEAAYPYPIWPWQQAQGFPWRFLQFYRSKEPLKLDGGSELGDLCLAYEEWGDRRHPAVIVFHALTGDSHVARHTPDDRPGWWDGVVGPGLALDTNRYFVLSANAIGGAMGSTAPSTPDAGGTPYGRKFPRLTLFDMARATRRLVEERGIQGPVVVMGGSMGGMMALAYAALYADDVAAVLAIGAPIQHEPWAIAYHTVGRTAIRQDPAFHDGDYYRHGEVPAKGLAVARMADMISYQHPESMALKFGRRFQTAAQDEFQIESYLRYQGQKLVTRFDANTYLVFTEAMDQFALEPAHMDQLVNIPVWMTAISSDMLYPAAEIAAHGERLRQAGVAVTLTCLKGPWGHDTFLVDQEQTGRLITDFLSDPAVARRLPKTLGHR